METIIQHYKSLLPAEQFILTGSYSFYVMGLVIAKAVTKDIDIILVNPKQEAIANLELLQNSGKSKALAQANYPGGNKMYRIIHDIDDSKTVKIDFFIDTQKQPTFKLESGLEVAKINITVNAKKRFNRLKDVLQLKAIAESIYTDTMLKAILEKETSKFL